MIEFLLNTDVLIVKWGGLVLSIVLAIFAIAYFNLSLKKHFSLERGLIQVAPLFAAIFINLVVQNTISQLTDYSQSQLSGLILKYNLTLYKTDKLKSKMIIKENKIGQVDCKDVTFKECVIKVKNNQYTIIN